MANHIVECFINYPVLFTPKLGRSPKPGDKPKYSAELLFTQAQTETPAFKALVEEVRASALTKFGEKDLKRGVIKLPFRTDVEVKDPPLPEEIVLFMNPGTYDAPGVFSRFAGKDGLPTSITDPKAIFSGCKVNALLVVSKPYEVDGSRGVTTYLNAVQLLDDTLPRLDGRVSASKVFKALDPEPTAEIPVEGGKRRGVLAGLVD